MENGKPKAIKPILRTRRGPMSRHRSSRRTTSARTRHYSTSTHADDDDNEVLIEATLSQSNGSHSNGAYQRRKDGYAPLQGDEYSFDDYQPKKPSPYQIFQIPSWLRMRKKDWILQCIYIVCGVLLYQTLMRISKIMSRRSEAVHLHTVLGVYNDTQPKIMQALNSPESIPSPTTGLKGSLRGYHSPITDIGFSSNDDMVVPYSAPKEKTVLENMYESHNDDNVEPNLNLKSENEKIVATSEEKIKGTDILNAGAALTAEKLNPLVSSTLANETSPAPVNVTKELNQHVNVKDFTYEPPFHYSKNETVQITAAHNETSILNQALPPVEKMIGVQETPQKNPAEVMEDKAAVADIANSIVSTKVMSVIQTATDDRNVAVPIPPVNVETTVEKVTSNAIPNVPQAAQPQGNVSAVNSPPAIAVAESNSSGANENIAKTIAQPIQEQAQVTQEVNNVVQTTPTLPLSQSTAQIIPIDNSQQIPVENTTTQATSTPPVDQSTTQVTPTPPVAQSTIQVTPAQPIPENKVVVKDAQAQAVIPSPNQVAGTAETQQAQIQAVSSAAVQTSQ